jgi:hypothetical protein
MSFVVVIQGRGFTVSAEVKIGAIAALVSQSCDLFIAVVALDSRVVCRIKDFYFWLTRPLNLHKGVVRVLCRSECNTIIAQVKVRTIYTFVPGSEDNRFAEITNSRVHIDIFWRSYVMERIWNRLELVGSRMKTNAWWV